MASTDVSTKNGNDATSENQHNNVDGDKVISELAQGVEDVDFVDPWTVVSKSEKGVDYDKLIGKSVISRFISFLSDT